VNQDDRKIMTLALAHNANADSAEDVISQALDGLRAEAQVLLDVIYEAKGCDSESVVMAYGHLHRIEALQLLIDRHMNTSWYAAPEAPNG